jgi:uncharacterized RDD family membrane protein YckC
VRARFWRRFVAQLVDGLVLLGPLLVILATTGLLTADAEEYAALGARRLIAGVATAAMSVAYHGFFVAKRGQTIGKMMLHVNVRDHRTGRLPSPDAAVIRAVVPVALASPPWPVVSLALTMALCFSIVTNPEGRGWHDRAAGTIVLPGEPDPLPPD